MGQPVYHVNEIEELGRGAKDPVILPYCGKFDTVLVTLDRRILRTPHLHALLSEYGVAAFFVRSQKKGSPDPWVIFKTLVKQWETIVRIAEREKRPFAKIVRPQGAIKSVKWR